ncbi:hypothetical protein JHK86_012981 [Glycine max]|nr:hypothetical protein JHK86_012981 [Glycine max]
MDLSSLFLVLIPLLTSFAVCQLEEFVSIDCGGTSNYTDTSTGLAWISDSRIMQHGISVEVESPNRSMVQYQKRRDFPIESKKYCYTLSTEERRRYLVRATFQYGSLDSGDTYPQFQLYLDATKWATVSIYDASRIYVKEMIIRAPSNSIDVCMCCATTGSPFISTLELRPLNLSMYATDFEDNFFLEVAARINFGAPTEDAVRYPDDPYDRIWDSDLIKRQNYLVGVAPGTERISTTRNIDIETREYPPVKVMQTAVVGTKGVLSYRLNLEDFPANARAYAYFAEIEDLGQNESRKFKLKQPYIADYSNAVVNIAENANGSYTLYEPSYMNVTLEFVLSFSFVMTPDSTRGPLLNALEISKYVQIASKTDKQDTTVVNAFRLLSAQSSQTNEGDPCVPTPWEWVNCSTTTPPRITKIILSRRNVKGEIPSELSNMEALTELWLDGNLLTGQLPDMSKLINLKIVHLENNKLTGRLPSDMGSLPSLQAFYDGNAELHRGKKKHFKMVLGISIGVLVILLILFLVSLVLLLNTRRKASKKKREEKGISGRTNSKPGYSFLRGGNLMDENTTCYITLSELKEATDNFSKKIGKGSFGSVYYGKMRDGKEIAVKSMNESSCHGNQQFVNEARSLTHKGDAMSIIDPSLEGNAKTESIWRVVEIAMQCVEQHGASRPRMQEIILAIQDAIKIEKGTENKLKSSSSFSDLVIEILKQIYSPKPPPCHPFTYPNSSEVGGDHGVAEEGIAGAGEIEDAARVALALYGIEIALFRTRNSHSPFIFFKPIPFPPPQKPYPPSTTPSWNGSPSSTT